MTKRDANFSRRSESLKEDRPITDNNNMHGAEHPHNSLFANVDCRSDGTAIRGRNNNRLIRSMNTTGLNTTWLKLSKATFLYPMLTTYLHPFNLTTCNFPQFTIRQYTYKKIWNQTKSESTECNEAAIRLPQIQTLYVCIYAIQ